MNKKNTSDYIHLDPFRIINSSGIKLKFQQKKQNVKPNFPFMERCCLPTSKNV